MTEPWLETLPRDECLALLRATAVGRVGIVSKGLPLVLPVNYRVVGDDARFVIAIRTRAGNVIDNASTDVAFEIDGIDASHRRGWSVLVRGTLLHHEDALPIWAVLGSDSWIPQPDGVWLTIEPFEVTGRRLRSETIEWAFLATGYL